MIKKYRVKKRQIYYYIFFGIVVGMIEIKYSVCKTLIYNNRIDKIIREY